jgi:uncharacterized repeat protein (TIGR01451 family)
MPTKLLLVVFTLFSTTISLQAQCPTTDLVFYNQQQVDSFTLLYPNCTVIPGNMTFRDFTSDVQGLNQITKISGSLLISNNANMATMAALSQLSFVEGNLEISNNTKLTSLSGLQNLSRISGGLEINLNQNLTHLNDFQALTDLDSTLSITSNQKLKSVSGLQQLQYIGGSLEVLDNQDLRHLSGFDQVAFVGQNVTISKLVINGFVPDTLQILASAVQIGGNLKIFNGKYVRGFHALAEVVGDVSINCSGTVDGFRKLKRVGGSMTCRQGSSLAIFNEMEEITGRLDIYAPTSATEPVFTGLRNLYGTLNVSISNGERMWLQGFQQLTTCGNITLSGDSLLMIPQFENLTTLNGSFRLDYSKIEKYTGLNKLKIAHGGISVAFCNSLKVLNICAAIEEAGSLSITGNSLLDTIQGFDLLKNMNTLKLSNNTSLRKVSEFPNLTSVTGSLTLETLGFRELPKFSALKSIGANLSLNDMQKLKSLNSFEVLDSISAKLFISRLDSLVSFEGFSLLALVNSVEIISMKSLQSLGDFPNLSSIQSVRINSNPKLSDCDAYFLCQFLATNVTLNNLSIYGNAPGCNNKFELESGCTGLFPTVKGRVYADLDNNGQYSSGDKPLANKFIRKTSGLPFTMTKATGHYQALLPYGVTIITSDTTTYPGYLLEPYSYTVNATSTNDTFANRDFRYYPIGPFANLCMSMSVSGAPRPGFSHTYTIEVVNIGSVVTDGVINFSILDPHPDIVIQSADQGATFTTKDAVLEIVQLQPFDKIVFHVIVQINANVSLLNQVFSVAARAEVLDIQDIEPNNNATGRRLTIVGSYDPNDKTVNQDEFDLDDIAGKKLDLVYQIRFQNTGTYPAEFVVVKDTLPTWLDMRSFEMLQASHTYTMDFSDPRVLHWRFDSIQLADSASNEPESHGYILFKIRTQGNFTLYDTIQNRCGIYFDFNPPVITNYAKTSFFERVNVDNAANQLSLRLSPNPVQEQLHVQFDAQTTGTYQFTVYASDGTAQLRREVDINQIGAQQIDLNLAPIGAGAKILQVKSAHGVTNQVFLRL